MSNRPKTTFYKNFPVNVWGLSVLIGSILFGIFLLSGKDSIADENEFLSAFLVLVLFAGVFSWPTFLLCFFALRYFTRKGMQPAYIFGLTYTLALLGIFATVLFFEEDIFEDGLLVASLISYIIGFTISFFLLTSKISKRS